MYREKTVRQYEYSMDFLLKYNKLFLDERLGLTAAVGANRLSNKYASTTIDAPELGINGPGMYTMANSAVALEVSPYRSRKEIQSVYGFVNLSWDDTYFLDVTARNDWSSTLHPTKWSYFYPSVSASILLDNLFKIRSNDINMIKLRGSWANVGNDTGVYSLYPDYSGTSFPGSVSLPSTPAQRIHRARELRELGDRSGYEVLRQPSGRRHSSVPEYHHQPDHIGCPVGRDRQHVDEDQRR